jgi:hypothetical protein
MAKILLAAGIVLATTFAVAQPPERKREDGAKATSESIVKRLMAFDKNKDGKLTREEVTDKELHRLFDRADANKDGVVTREELEALAAQESAIGGGGKGGRGGEGGKGGKGKGKGKGKGGPGGPGGPGGFGMRGMQPGQILSPFVAEMLKLTDAQKKEIADLQKDVNGKLDKILTDEQKKQLKDLRERGGRPGRPGERP